MAIGSGGRDCYGTSSAWPGEPKRSCHTYLAQRQYRCDRNSLSGINSHCIQPANCRLVPALGWLFCSVSSLDRRAKQQLRKACYALCLSFPKGICVRLPTCQQQIRSIEQTHVAVLILFVVILTLEPSEGDGSPHFLSVLAAGYTYGDIAMKQQQPPTYQFMDSFSELHSATSSLNIKGRDTLGTAPVVRLIDMTRRRKLPFCRSRSPRGMRRNPLCPL